MGSLTDQFVAHDRRHPEGQPSALHGHQFGGGHDAGTDGARRQVSKVDVRADRRLVVGKDVSHRRHGRRFQKGDQTGCGQHVDIPAHHRRGRVASPNHQVGVGFHPQCEHHGFEATEPLNRSAIVQGVQGRLHPEFDQGGTSVTKPFLVALLLIAAACGSSPAETTNAIAVATTGTVEGTSTTAAYGPEPVIDPGDGGVYRPIIDPANFVDVIDNPYLLLTVGSRWVYEGTSEGEAERVEIVVTDERRVVMGVETTVVRDSVYVEGELVEDTFDWYAQDGQGNVWYFGEDVKDYDNGQVVSTAGSWEAGVDGALPGIVMPAQPKVGRAYRQEYYPGEAEDMFEIVAVDGTRQVAAGSFDGLITTRDWSPLEPEVIEEKTYAFGVGKIAEAKVAGGEGSVELIEYTLGG